MAANRQPTVCGPLLFHALASSVSRERILRPAAELVELRNRSQRWGIGELHRDRLAGFGARLPAWKHFRTVRM